MLKLAKERQLVNPCITSQIDANLMHLLFVKFDKDPKLAERILREALEMGIDVNHVDKLNATPIHVAMRKRQVLAIEMAVKINKEYGRPIFDFNVINARGTTPVHYAIEKHDHEMLIAILEDPYVDLRKTDEDRVCKARRLTVIFSAFHKILYQREKIIAKREFVRNNMNHGKSNRFLQNQGFVPVSMSNKSIKSYSRSHSGSSSTNGFFSVSVDPNNFDLTSHQIINKRSIKPRIESRNSLLPNSSLSSKASYNIETNQSY